MDHDTLQLALWALIELAKILADLKKSCKPPHKRRGKKPRNKR